MSHFVVPLIAAMAMIMAAPGYAQISTPCNASMITAFTPCMNFLTNSSFNGTSPTADCCNSLKSITSGGMDCLCLIVTGSVPFRIPFNRTLAISLPRACNMPGVPVQCNKTPGSPIPAPGPATLGPSSSPASSPSAPSGFTPSPSPQASSVLPSPTTPAEAPDPEAPEPDATNLNPPSPSVETNTGRSGLNPSSAASSYSPSSSFLLIALGFLVLKYY